MLKRLLVNIFVSFVDSAVWLASKIDKNGYVFLNTLREAYLKQYKEILDISPKALYPSIYYVQPQIKTSTNDGELAIVIQGLIETKDDFTIETVRFYKKLFKGAHIIVSTWDSTPKELLNEFIKEGCHVVINKSFKPCGLGNVNYQICTSFSGVKKAKELGAKYVLKNRSDLRIYREYTFEYLKSLLELFPVKDHEIPLKGRIITLSGMEGQMIYVNWYQDFFYFGYTDDIYNLFDIPYDNRGEEVYARRSREYFNYKYDGLVNGDQICQDGTPEVYITKTFLSKYISCKMDLFSSWDYHKKYFYVIDFRTIEAIWYKYKRYIVYSENQGKKSITDRMRNFNILNSTCLITDKLIYEEWLEEERFKIQMGTRLNKNWLK